MRVKKIKIIDYSYDYNYNTLDKVYGAVSMEESLQEFM